MNLGCRSDDIPLTQIGFVMNQIKIQLIKVRPSIEIIGELGNQSSVLVLPR